MNTGRLFPLEIAALPGMLLGGGGGSFRIEEYTGAALLAAGGALLFVDIVLIAADANARTNTRERPRAALTPGGLAAGIRF